MRSRRRGRLRPEGKCHGSRYVCVECMHWRPPLIDFGNFLRHERKIATLHAIRRRFNQSTPPNRQCMLPAPRPTAALPWLAPGNEPQGLGPAADQTFVSWASHSEPQRAAPPPTRRAGPQRQRFGPRASGPATRQGHGPCSLSPPTRWRTAMSETLSSLSALPWLAEASAKAWRTLAVAECVPRICETFAKLLARRCQ